MGIVYCMHPAQLPQAQGKYHIKDILRACSKLVSKAQAYHSQLVDVQIVELQGPVV